LAWNGSFSRNRVAEIAETIGARITRLLTQMTNRLTHASAAFSLGRAARRSD
jgi:hypothetical protein